MDGRLLDNVFVERLWRSLKYEEAHLNAEPVLGPAVGWTHRPMASRRASDRPKVTEWKTRQ